MNSQSNNRPGNNAITNPLALIPDLNELQLDIVGFLAILGEGSVLANAQVTALSRWTFLPRLIPAPQALLRTTRPDRLQGAPNRMVIGATSGNVRHHLNHVANIIHSREEASGENLKPFSVKVVRLREAGETEKDIKAKSLSPLTALNLFGCLMSILLVVFTLLQGDGFAFGATVLLSLLSMMVGLGCFWKIKLPKRQAPRKIPNSDIIINYPHGAFVIVKDCTEEVARKLYFAIEECEYLINEQAYRAVALFGTMLLMGGVIFLANANLYSQLAFAVAYILLNAAYWVVAALPQHWNWDLSNFIVTPIRIKKGFGTTEPERNATFTDALWNVIAVTKSSRWARTSGSAPNTPEWDLWLEQAEAKSQEGSALYTIKTDTSGTEEWLALPEWDPSAAYTEIIRQKNDKEANGIPTSPVYSNGACATARSPSQDTGNLRNRGLPPTFVQMHAEHGDEAQRRTSIDAIERESLRAISRDGSVRASSRPASMRGGASLGRLSREAIERNASREVLDRMHSHDSHAPPSPRARSRDAADPEKGLRAPGPDGPSRASGPAS